MFYSSVRRPSNIRWWRQKSSFCATSTEKWIWWKTCLLCREKIVPVNHVDLWVCVPSIIHSMTSQEILNVCVSVKIQSSHGFYLPAKTSLSKTRLQIYTKWFNDHSILCSHLSPLKLNGESPRHNSGCWRIWILCYRRRLGAVPLGSLHKAECWSGNNWCNMVLQNRILQIKAWISLLFAVWH